jgi:hypothetical protein
LGEPWGLGGPVSGSAPVLASLWWPNSPMAIGGGSTNPKRPKKKNKIKLRVGPLGVVYEEKFGGGQNGVASHPQILFYFVHFVF